MKELKVHLYARSQSCERVGELWNEDWFHRESFFMINLKKSFSFKEYSSDFSINLSEEGFNKSLNGQLLEVFDGDKKISLKICDERESS